MEVTIHALEGYLAQNYGGRANEQSMFMKLVEEMGEVAEILNQRAGRKAADGSDLDQALATELADMIHYIMAIAAINGLDMNKTILEKDKKASIKYHHNMNLETYLQTMSRE